MTNSSEKPEKSKPKLRPRPVRFSQWNRELPIWREEETIRSAISKHPIVVLTAPPATGKSTQLPIMMLEEGFKKIVLVVPIGIVALQLAETISLLLDNSEEYGPDKKVGLATGQRSAYNFANNRVLVMTSGFAIAYNLVSKLTKEHLLILDELHEWSEEQEALNGLVMQRIQERGFRCIETSATLDHASLVAYHQAHVGKDCSIHLQVCAGVEERHAIKDLSISELQNSILELKEKDSRYDDLSDVLSYAARCEKEKKAIVYFAFLVLYCAIQGYDILVFLCGQHAIKELRKLALAVKENSSLPHEIFEVYGEKGFNEIEHAVTYISGPKILLSTNILESGFNPKISPQSKGLAVIDYLDKYENYFDAEQNIKGIRKVIGISEAEQIQRRRRTGRDCQGIYISIPIDNSSEFSVTPEEDDIISTQTSCKYPIPSIERAELSEILLKLRVHQVQLENLPLFHSPAQDAIKQSLNNLKAINCIDESGNITDIGHAAARLGLSPSASRIVLEAKALFPDLVDEALLVACILNAGGIIDRHKYVRGEKPKWLNFEEAGSFKSDLLLQAHILRNKLKVLGSKNQFLNRKDITEMQLSFKQIKEVQKNYHNLKDLLRSSEMTDLFHKACQMIQSNTQAQSVNQFSSDNERLRYCIFSSLPKWLYYNSQLHVDEFTKRVLLSYGRTNIKNDLRYLSSDNPLYNRNRFKPDPRQCLLEYQDSAPEWIVANPFDHLENPTLFLYTEIELQWIVATNPNQDFTQKVLDLVFCSQGRCKWQKVHLTITLNGVVDYQVEKEGKNAKPIEVLAESMRCYGQVGNLKYLLSQLERQQGKPESFLESSDITSPPSLKIGQVVEGRIRGIKSYGAFIDIGLEVGSALLHNSEVSQENIESCHDVFNINEEIKAMIIDLDKDRGRISLSLKELEPEPGDVLNNRDLVFQKAEEMAAYYRMKHGIDEIQSEKENEITESDRLYEIDLSKVQRLTNYVIARLYSFVRELITKHQDTGTDSTERDILAEICSEWASNCLTKLPQDLSLNLVKKKHLDDIINAVIEKRKTPS